MTDEPELTLDIDMMTDAVIVRCRGALTLTSAGRLRHEIKRLLPQTRVVTIDFTDLARIDSVGLGTLASLYVSARNAGRDGTSSTSGPAYARYSPWPGCFHCSNRPATRTSGFHRSRTQ